MIILLFSVALMCFRRYDHVSAASSYNLELSEILNTAVYLMVADFSLVITHPCTEEH